MGIQMCMQLTQRGQAIAWERTTGNEYTYTNTFEASHQASLLRRQMNILCSRFAIAPGETDVEVRPEEPGSVSAFDRAAIAAGAANVVGRKPRIEIDIVLIGWLGNHGCDAEQ